MGQILSPEICPENGRLILELPGNMVTFRVLEPYAVKVASTVLRRVRRGNPPDLSDSALNQNILDLFLQID